MLFIDQFKAARRCSTPLIGIQTADPAATMNHVNEKTIGDKRYGPIVRWDCASGFQGINAAGKETVTAIVAEINPPAKLLNPVEALMCLPRMPDMTVLFFLNAQRFFSNVQVIQAIWNLRDTIKGKKTSLVLLGPLFTLPAELVNDVLMLDEPLPTTEQLKSIIGDAYQAGKLEPPKGEKLDLCVDAVLGLPAYSAEQASMMSMTPEGMDMESLWEKKRKQIEQTKGASVYRGDEKFSSIRGCTNAIGFVGRSLKGKRRYRAIVLLDEIGKAFAGLGGDTSGVTQELCGALLTYMQDRKATGCLFMGVPGSAKSAIAKACGNEAGIPTIAASISDMKGSLVGESSQNMRNFLKMVDSVSQGSAFFIGTTNEMTNLPGELRRRFKRGTFFFDLLSDEERVEVLNLYTKKHGLKKQPVPDMEGWTGAEVEQCCEMASEMDLTLMQAARYIVPVARSAKERIDEMRREATGRFLSASFEGFYHLPEAKVSKGRSID